MVMEPSCKISLCIFSSILFWIYCFDFYHIYVHIKAQLFIVKVNLQSMSFSVFCLPRLEVWSCSLTSVSAWLTLSPFSLGSPFYKEVCPWPWSWCTMERARGTDSYVFWGKTGGVYLCWAGHSVTPSSLPDFQQRINGGQGLGECGRRSVEREEEDDRKQLANV